MPRALVFGASGAVGRFLLPRLLERNYDVIAVSRRARLGDDDMRVQWRVGDLHAPMPTLPSADVVFSLGPLDAFAHWFATTEAAPAPRVIALGSMSAESKRDSASAAERELARRLGDAEQKLLDAGQRLGSACTVFRPTLIYGAGVDRSLSPIARRAMRWRVFPRVAGATGLRQPVHADDLAEACVAALSHAQTAGRVYALGGGERLAFAAMLERVRRSLPVATLPLPIPLSAARLFARRLRMPQAAALDRLRTDLVADHAAASADFGWSPRSFHPTADMWMAR